jgi:type VI secretion system protein ImpG
VASGREAFMELLSLYNYSDSAVIKKQIRGIAGLNCKPTVARMTTLGRQSFVQGLDIAIEFDEFAYAGGGVYLFAAVLERFLALYASVNSFTKLSARLREREKELAVWPPRAGHAILA